MRNVYQIIYWRDIPSQIKAKKGRKRLSRPLTDRFMQTIDSAAMHAGDTGADDYLEQWRTTAWANMEGDVDEFLDGLVREIEARYSGKKLSQLAKNGGWEEA